MADREGDWALHLTMEEEIYYLHSMEVMPQDVRIEFALLTTQCIINAVSSTASGQTLPLR